MELTFWPMQFQPLVEGFFRLVMRKQMSVKRAIKSPFFALKDFLLLCTKNS